MSSKNSVVILKVPKGVAAPPGYEFIRTTRSGDIYHKPIEVITPDMMDELSGLFNSGMKLVVVDRNVEQQAVSALENENDDILLGMFGSMKVGGKKKRKNSRKSIRPRRSRKHKKSNKRR